MQSPPRILQLEYDALRQELHEWRHRAAILRIEAPMRSDGFSMILSGELEVIAAVPGDADEEEEYDGEGGNDGGHTWMILGGTRLARLSTRACRCIWRSMMDG